ncbi:MAG: xylulokinase, partial [Chloroflexota bacterium]|nr:xylulokinase [Chloroflexota bacterium]
MIGCDVGTQSAKALLLDDQGTTVARASRSYPTAHPAAGWAEQSPDDWLGAVRGAIADVVRSAGISASAVGGLGIAAQVDGIVAVDSANRPLAPAPIWMDRRATAVVDRAAARVPADRIR